jgi:hypothetical protein
MCSPEKICVVSSEPFYIQALHAYLSFDWFNIAKKGDIIDGYLTQPLDIYCDW